MTFSTGGCAVKLLRMTISGKAFMQPSLSRGSTWRKWDLHVHAPSSVFYNNFPKPDGRPDWEAYFKILDASGVSAVGITDYFSIEGYKRVKKAQQDGKLPRIGLVLPNIEFRLDLLVPTSKEDNNGKVKRLMLTSCSRQKFLSLI